MARRTKGGLGRGLDALLGGEIEEVKAQPAEITEAVSETEREQHKKSTNRVVVVDAEASEIANVELEQAMMESKTRKVARDDSKTAEQKEKNNQSVSKAAEEAGEEKALKNDAGNKKRTERAKPTKRKASAESQNGKGSVGTGRIVKIQPNVAEAFETPVQEERIENGKAEAVEQDVNKEAALIEVAEQIKGAGEETSGQEEAVKDSAKEESRQPAVVVDSNKDRNYAIHEVESKDSRIVPIAAITPNPNQPRTNFKKEELDELASSIERDGLLQPILVRPMGNGRYQIIAGERRWQACRLVGLKKVPVKIKEADDMQALELGLIENIQRADLNPIEEAYGYRRIMDRKKITQSQLAQMVSKGRSTIANALRLLDLPEDAQQLLYEDKITAGHARAILSIPSEEGKQRLTDKLLKEKLSVRETENLARLIAGKEKAGESKPRPAMPKEFKMAAKELRQKYETNVRIKSVQGKNKIELEFKDEDDLKRIFALMMGEQSKAE